ncbi:MAG: hypothetical protein GXN93_02525 [Candidatus Diapherotrites archaeon]|nr:hypothetical protein [Candidatus Diapherotrites archaeon]
MGARVTVKKNPRNIVIITPIVVLKYRRDWNLRKIFWEFALTWKAFLHGISTMPVLFGPIIVRRTIGGTLLTRANINEAWRQALEAIAEISAANIEHLEVRHPQYHMIVKKDGTVAIIDFERGKLTRRTKNIPRFVVWLLERGISPDDVDTAIKSLKYVKEHEKKGAEKSISYHRNRRRTQSARQ